MRVRLFPTVLGCFLVAGSAGAAPRVTSGEASIVLRAPWGAGLGQLGRVRPDQASPECPSAFEVDPSGTFWVLDGVNDRVELFPPNGAPRVIKLRPASTFEDLVIDDGGGVVLLDRTTPGTLAFVNPNGEIDHEVPLYGRGVPNPGRVTALFKRDDGYWVEYDAAAVVRVATIDGQPDLARPRVQGRWVPKSKEVVNGRISADHRSIDLLFRRELTVPSEPVRTVTVRFPKPALFVHELLPGPDGSIALSAVLNEEEARAPFRLLRQDIMVAAAMPDGRELWRTSWAQKPVPETPLRSLRRGPDGAVYFLSCDEDAAIVRKVSR